MKTCQVCLCDKPVDQFAIDPRSRDGRRATCKACRNSVARAKYLRDREEVLCAQKKLRDTNPEADRAKKRKYRATERGRLNAVAHRAKYKADFPERIRAKGQVAAALLAGRIQKTPCFVCGSSEVEGHHPDYSHPLDVVWLCHLHHAQTHKLAADLDRLS
ncbi:TPA: hypothetical protein VDA67_006397 [Burkholderia vietnamiensis]|nr:hypothetical protein [Burkholderia vietnamiensis]HEP6287896.1 hypothetical protein [Burkholderia vietnamiensis]HEP6312805.1 hypothetical protein [Burkholderia vietnamiensis]